jgi:hypothetical protein
MRRDVSVVFPTAVLVVVVRHTRAMHPAWFDRSSNSILVIVLLVDIKAPTGPHQ